MPTPIQAILIAGTSHVGKSTLAEKLAERLGWNGLSTDKLGRHPGRPWLGVPAPVTEFYERLTPETIHWFLKVHHENMWRQVRPMIEAERAAGRRFVLEGAALRPEYIAPLLTDEMVGVLLHADDGFLLARMRAAASYEGRDAGERRIIDAFIDRSIRENAALMAASQEVGLRMVDAADAHAVAALADELVERAAG
ncbi:AAA family ATPase [Pleomorphomonas oryzae]|uniref:AAA family ATPase n=1 Tax=Pleomorphomonas oryzae TaxID=261934 RepID=UPI000400BEF8|nr:AAA family ATPase [Pleomorphomonas oryzae]